MLMMEVRSAKHQIRDVQQKANEVNRLVSREDSVPKHLLFDDKEMLRIEQHVEDLGCKILLKTELSSGVYRPFWKASHSDWDRKDGSAAFWNAVERNLDATYRFLGSLELALQHSQQDSVDFDGLIRELSELRQEMKKEPVTPEQEIAVANIEKAESAAGTKDSSKLSEHLKSAGKLAFDVVIKIGAGLAVEAIKKSTGM